MLAGSPPCSPQTPSLSVGSRRCAALGGHLDERADALLVERDERVLRQDARLDVRGQELPGVVAREAHRGLRESFVPKEKNSAGRASSPARSAARGSSIIVPNVNGTRLPAFSKTSFATSSTIARVCSSSARVIASGIMISGCTSMPSLATCDGGLEDGAHLHRVDLGVRDGEAAAAVAEHRVELVQVLRALRELLHRHAHRPSTAARAASARSAGTRAAAGRAGES